MVDPVTVRVFGCGGGAAAVGFEVGALAEGVVGGALGATDVCGACGVDAGAGGLDAGAAGNARDEVECVLKSSSMTSPATVATSAAKARFIALTLPYRPYERVTTK